jgi:hypothetical protein
VKPSTGDLLRIRAAEDLTAEAQIVRAHRGSLLLGVLRIGEMREEVPILLVETVDNFVRNGKWEHLGNRPVMEIPEPLFAMRWTDSAGSHIWIRDFEGNPIREAKPAEVVTLRESVSFSPAAVEQAIRAFAGPEKWIPAFDAIMFGDVRR